MRIVFKSIITQARVISNVVALFIISLLTSVVPDKASDLDSPFQAEVLRGAVTVKPPINSNDKIFFDNIIISSNKKIDNDNIKNDNII